MAWNGGASSLWASVSPWGKMCGRMCQEVCGGPALGWGLSWELPGGGHVASLARPRTQVDRSRHDIASPGGTPLFSALPHARGPRWLTITSPLFQVVNRLGLDSLSPFNPKERIIE